jgi:hypothetical protein
VNETVSDFKSIFFICLFTCGILYYLSMSVCACDCFSVCFCLCLCLTSVSVFVSLSASVSVCVSHLSLCLFLCLLLSLFVPHTCLCVLFEFPFENCWTLLSESILLSILCLASAPLCASVLHFCFFAVATTLELNTSNDSTQVNSAFVVHSSNIHYRT